jgi:reactive intermediate/imine deaminase
MKLPAASVVIVALTCGFGVSCAPEHSPPSSQHTPSATVIEFLTSPETEAMDLPFSDAVRVGDLLFLSGQLGNVPGTSQLVEGGIAAETRQTMENISAILEQNGSSLDRVVKCTIFLADISEWGAMNEVYRTFFPDALPARSAFAATGLALGARVEIDCIAVAG